MICPYCKNHIQEGAKACPCCGVSYINKTQQPYPTEQLNQQNQQPRPIYQQPQQQPMYNPYMYRQPVQYTQPKKSFYTGPYWASNLLGLFGTILMTLALFTPFVFDVTLIESDKANYIFLAVIVIIFICCIPFKPLYTVDAVLRILAGIFSGLFIVYQYIISVEALERNGLDESHIKAFLGSGFYCMAAGIVFLFISGCIAVPAINDYKGGRV